MVQWKCWKATFASSLQVLNVGIYLEIGLVSYNFWVNLAFFSGDLRLLILSDSFQSLWRKYIGEKKPVVLWICPHSLASLCFVRAKLAWGTELQRDLYYAALSCQAWWLQDKPVTFAICYPWTNKELLHLMSCLCVSWRADTVH